MSVSVILRRVQVQAQTGLSRSSIYLRMAQGLWPRPVKLGKRAVGWPSSEIEALNNARIRGCADGEIRTLVSQLERARRVS